VKPGESTSTALATSSCLATGDKDAVGANRANLIASDAVVAPLAEPVAHERRQLLKTMDDDHLIRVRHEALERDLLIEQGQSRQEVARFWERHFDRRVSDAHTVAEPNYERRVPASGARPRSASARSRSQ
jgi:hypothetical protein